MYKVTAYFRDHKVSQKFYDMYDAIDWRDSADAHYPKDVKFEKVNDMREFVYTSWNSVKNVGLFFASSNVPTVTAIAPNNATWATALTPKTARP